MLLLSCCFPLPVVLSDFAAADAAADYINVDERSGRKRTLPLQNTARLISGTSGGCGERSLALSSMISRLNLTPWMPCPKHTPNLTTTHLSKRCMPQCRAILAAASGNT